MSEAKGFCPVRLAAAAVLARRAEIEYELLPVCREEGLGVISWGPFGGGFLSGKYRCGEEPPEGSRIAGRRTIWRRPGRSAPWSATGGRSTWSEIAEETGKSYARISLNWLLRQPGVTAPILGFRRFVSDLPGDFGLRAVMDRLPEETTR